LAALLACVNVVPPFSKPFACQSAVSKKVNHVILHPEAGCVRAGGGGSIAYPLKQLMIGVFDCPPLLTTGVKKVKAAAKPKTKKAAPVKA
jgi:hypothetical protein